MPQYNVVGISGSLSRPSRTAALVAAVLREIEVSEIAEAHLFDLADLAPGLLAAGAFDQLTTPSREIIERIEAADLIVVGTPVYRGSYTGVFKHLFDLVRHDRLRGTPVVITATGGSPMHALVTEHQLRPLFGFFAALTLPTTVYATEGDFKNHAIVSDAILQRIRAAAREGLHALGRHPRPAKPTSAPAGLEAAA